MSRLYRRSVTVNGAEIAFWVAEGEVISQPALIAEGPAGGRIVEDPATRESVEAYSEQELVRLYYRRAE